MKMMVTHADQCFRERITMLVNVGLGGFSLNDYLHIPGV